jgi:hypothetical protein
VSSQKSDVGVLTLVFQNVVHLGNRIFTEPIKLKRKGKTGHKDRHSRREGDVKRPRENG